LASITPLPPAAKGGVMNTLLPGEVGAGQSAPIKRRQKLSALGGVSPSRAATRRNIVFLHGRVLSRPVADE
jgi:hypothetical protein